MGEATCCRAASAPTRRRWLDQLCAAGEVVWVGAGALGRRSGSVALYFREDARCSARRPAAAEAPADPAHEAIRERLRAGACFFTDLLVDVAGITTEELQEALWDLVWAGEVTNDAFAPLRSPKLSAAVVPAGARRPPPLASPPAAAARSRRSRAAGR